MHFNRCTTAYPLPIAPSFLSTPLLHPASFSHDLYDDGDGGTTGERLQRRRVECQRGRY